VSRLYEGNLVLAGDAAHLYSPLGGTGMNTGMQDAFNLGWRLALAERTGGSNHALSGYERERMPVIRQTAQATTLLTRLAGREETGSALIAPYLPVLSQRRFVRDVLPKVHAGLAQHYGGPPSESGSALVGSFCSDFAHQREKWSNRESAPQRARYVLATILIRVDDPLAKSAALAICDVRSRLAAHGTDVECLLLTGEAQPAIAEAQSAPICWLEGVGLHDRGILVVRADSVIAWVGGLADTARLFEFLSSLAPRHYEAPDNQRGGTPCPGARASTYL
jgi:hypothetical protein